MALEPPELEMRVAILLSKAAQTGMKLDEQVAFFIAKHIRSNVRELEGALKRVLAYSSFHGQEISLAVAKDALRDLLAVQNRQISIENIQKTVADYYKIRDLRHALEEALARDRPAAAGRDGAGQGADAAVACPKSAAISAVATTRRCCTPAARSPSSARLGPGDEPRRQFPAAGAAQLTDLAHWYESRLEAVYNLLIKRPCGSAGVFVPKPSTAPHTVCTAVRRMRQVPDNALSFPGCTG